MAALRETVLRRNIFDWALEVLDTMVGVNLRMPAPEASAAAATEPDATSG
jgi:hypothetical protein